MELHKLALINPTDYLPLYRQYRNIFNSLLRASKSMYYDTKFSQYARDPKKTWDLLNELTSNSRHTKSPNIPILTTPTSTISDPTAIAEEFNSFFSQAGKNISDSVPPTSTTPDSYFPPSNTPSFELGNTGPIHISDLIKSFPNKTSIDIDGISLKLLKFINIEISTPLAYIFDLSLTNGTFPSKLKLNRTVPIHKSGDTKKCDNYRPISLIPTLSKILEKIGCH
jgi:potassium voltage-gated channel Eag-related subfamily H protein 8